MGKITNFFSYYFEAKTIYNIHSPYMYNFVTNVLDTKKTYYPFYCLEQLRKEFLQSREEITYVDYGAGSRKMTRLTRKVKDIVRYNATSPGDCRILFNAVCHFHPHMILELGTSLGIGTAYLASANKRAVVHTIEGNPESVRLAQENFDILQLSNIHVHQGQIARVLPEILSSIKRIDLVFMDGHHDKAATLEYFNMMKPYLHKKSIVILDDIYWSDGMKKAWDTLINDAFVSASINIYTKGFLIFDDRFKSKQHLIYIPYQWKPWKIGIFG